MTRKFYRLFLLVLTAVIFAGMPAAAQKSASKEQRERWFKEMRQLKCDFIVKELKLTDEQKAKFIPVYEKMETESSQLNRETRRLVRSVEKKGTEATDIEREKAAEASFELRSKEGALEMNFYRQLKTILTPDQLLRYKTVENRFTHELMNHRKKHKER